MARFISRVVGVEAVQVLDTGSDPSKPAFSEQPSWLVEATSQNKIVAHTDGSMLWDVKTAAGTIVAKPGDWIVRGGPTPQFSVCPADVFAATYEQV